MSSSALIFVMQLLIATKNSAKISDYQQILEKFGIETVTLKDLNILGDVEETGKTLEENAILKVSYFSKLAKMPTIADDTGFEIDALGGEPGVHARRWPGYEATDEELIQMATSRLQGVPKEKRTAKMTNIIALATASGAIVSTSAGHIEGFIPEKISEKRIPHFPYRSILFIPKFNKFFVDLTEKEFNGLNFRYRAVEKIIPQIKILTQ